MRRGREIANIRKNPKVLKQFPELKKPNGMVVVKVIC
jgi:hypothetical protein